MKQADNMNFSRKSALTSRGILCCNLQLESLDIYFTLDETRQLDYILSYLPHFKTLQELYYMM